MRNRHQEIDSHLLAVTDDSTDDILVFVRSASRSRWLLTTVTPTSAMCMICSVPPGRITAASTALVFVPQGKQELVAPGGRIDNHDLHDLQLLPPLLGMLAANPGQPRHPVPQHVPHCTKCSSAQPATHAATAGNAQCTFK